jgi:hypothetical protein
LFSRATFQVQVTLLRDGSEISRVDEKVQSFKELESNGTGAKRKEVFTSGFLATMEAIHEGIVITRDIHTKLQK